MINFLHSLLVVLSAFIGDLCTKNKVDKRTYFLLFVATYILSSCFYNFCDDFNDRQVFYFEEQSFKLPYHQDCQFTHEAVNYYVSNIDYHLMWGKEYFERSIEHAWYLPDLTDREKALECLKSVISASTGVTLQQKALNACVSLLTSYAIYASFNYNVMIENLYTSKYHYEMADFYLELLVKENENPERLLGPYRKNYKIDWERCKPKPTPVFKKK